MFSQLVDEIVTTTGRKDKLQDIINFINATIRECQMMAYFYRDLVEDQLPITDDTQNRLIWDYPKNFRQLRTVNYPGVANPKNLPPGRVQEGVKYFYYAASGYIVFAGVSGIENVGIAYYGYLKRLLYYTGKTGNEYPAVYDIEEETWSYWDGTAYVSSLATTDLEEAAQAKVANWVLFNWYDTARLGALAKIYLLLSDARAPAQYSLYKSSQKDILKGENFDSAGF